MVGAFVPLPCTVTRAGSRVSRRIDAAVVEIGASGKKNIERALLREGDKLVNPGHRRFLRCYELRRSGGRGKKIC